MNLTAAVKLEEVEKEIETYQKQLVKSIDDYEYSVRRLEKFVNILNDAGSSIERSKFEFDEWKVRF